MAISNVPGMREGTFSVEEVQQHISDRDTADYLDTKRALKTIALVVAVLGGSTTAAAALSAML